MESSAAQCGSRPAPDRFLAFPQGYVAAAGGDGSDPKSGTRAETSRPGSCRTLHAKGGVAPVTPPTPRSVPESRGRCGETTNAGTRNKNSEVEPANGAKQNFGVVVLVPEKSGATCGPAKSSGVVGRETRVAWGRNRQGTEHREGRRGTARSRERHETPGGALGVALHEARGLGDADLTQRTLRYTAFALPFEEPSALRILRMVRSVHSGRGFRARLSTRAALSWLASPRTWRHGGGSRGVLRCWMRSGRCVSRTMEPPSDT